MTEDRKFAIRGLLENGFRLIAICCESYEFKLYNPASWRRHYRLIKASALIARWLQKAAFYSAIDFDGFDEKTFWQEYRLFSRRLPNNSAFVLFEQFYKQHLLWLTGETDAD
ncbi:hypothetical protein [Hymenobacter koreensis]|uniref:hypothetical protein n=1 Tax=Hymenobacter koreensis TaxID=1084523 RepID=UPI0031EA4E5C